MRFVEVGGLLVSYWMCTTMLGVDLPVGGLDLAVLRSVADPRKYASRHETKCGVSIVCTTSTLHVNAGSENRHCSFLMVHGRLQLECLLTS